MNQRQSLEQYLDSWTKDKPTNRFVSETILKIALGSVELANLLRTGDLAADDTTVKTKADGDTQISMDIIADDIFYKCLQKAPVAVIASEETEHVRVIDRKAALAVAIDPLDGSSNVNINMSIGTIFSILPYQDSTDPELSFMQKGRHQLAAGFTLLGPQTLLILSVGTGTQVFIYDPECEDFVIYKENVKIPDGNAEYAINGSNRRHWSQPTSNFINECISGKYGSFDKDFNTRWTASMVADAYRILSRGGVYLYPGDERSGYEQGRLRLVYEANPIAFLMQQSGGIATDGLNPILDIKPQAVHQRIPLVFGSTEHVTRVASYFKRKQHPSAVAPLFGTRGLFQ